MKRRNLVWGSAAALLAAAAGAAAILAAPASKPPTDCQIVWQLLDYNTARNQEARKNLGPDAIAEPRTPDYRDWAHGLSEHADQIRDTALAADAQALVADTEALAALADKANSGGFGHEDPLAPPPWTQAYVDLAKDFDAHKQNLLRACPTR